MFACYDHGTIVGEFMVIFEQQGLALRAELRGNTLEILEKKTNQHKKEDLRDMI